jgi:hypothetical protein
VDVNSFENEGILDISRTLTTAKEEGISLDAFASYLKEHHPYEHEVFTQSPSAFLEMLGFSPSDFVSPQANWKVSLYDTLPERFTPEQREVIRRLESKGFDSMLVLQVYEACNCDETSAEECLKAFDTVTPHFDFLKRYLAL